MTLNFPPSFLSSPLECWYCRRMLLYPVGFLFSLFQRFIYFDFMCVFACMYMCTICGYCPQSSEGGIRSPATGVTDSCELPCGSRALNPGPLQEQPLLSHGVISPDPAPRVCWILLDSDPCRFPELAVGLRKGRACSSGTSQREICAPTTLSASGFKQETNKTQAPLLLPAQWSVPALAVPPGAESCWLRLTTAPAEPSTSPTRLQLAPEEDALVPSPLTVVGLLF
ncbi:hypothetical protein ACRRTK_007866 [Alexandromys fortis]